MNSSQIVTLVATILVGGGFATVVTQLLKRDHWSGRVNIILAIIVSGLVGLAASWLDGSIFKLIGVWGHVNAEQVLALAGTIFAAASAWYHVWFSGSRAAAKMRVWPSASPKQATTP